MLTKQQILDVVSRIVATASRPARVKADFAREDCCPNHNSTRWVQGASIKDQNHVAEKECEVNRAEKNVCAPAAEGQNAHHERHKKEHEVLIA